MLTKVILENFRSFKNKTIFDLESLKYQILQNTNVNEGILKGALIIGPNASGKSTLIVAVRTLLDMLFRDNFVMGAFDACLFCHKKNIHLEYHFLIDNKKIVYFFEVNKAGDITSENLIINEKKIIERDLQNAKVNINNQTTKIMNKLFSSKVLLLKKCYFSDFFVSMPIITKLMDFLHHSVYVDASIKIAHSYNNVSHIIQDVDQNVINEINSTFNSLNIGFKISKSKEDKISEINDFDGRVKSYRVKAEQPIIFFQRNDMNLNLPLDLESLGNQTLVNMIPSVLYCCQHKSLLLIDEFSSGFHNRLEELIIRYFFINSKDSQVIFTSHSTNLLNNKLLRPDQIYTVTFEPNAGSFIERFSDENPREAQNLEKMYLSGKFGSLPDYKL